MSTAEVTGLQATRLRRLEQIAMEMSRLMGEIALTHAAKSERKAQLYLNYPPNISHGERQARASHETVDLDNEETNLRAQLDQLKEERDLIRLLVDVW